VTPIDVLCHALAHSRAMGQTSRFVGRGRELQVLDDVLVAAAGGEGSAVLVTGPPGIGKTALCREVAGRARRTGFTVAWGGCWPDGGAPPWWPWPEILGAVDDGRGADLFGADHAAVVPERFARFTAILRILDTASARAPLLVVVDDIHAADASALLLVRFVARSVPWRPILLLLTRRDAAAAEPDLDDETIPVTLGGLDRADTGALARAWGEPIDDDLLTTLFRVTGGHPLHLRRVMAVGGPHVARHGVREVIAGAVRHLSDRASRELSLAALLGPTPSVFEAAALNRISPAALRESLAEAAADRLVELAGRSRFAFTHELVREVLVGQLRPADEVEAHARAADLLSAPAGDVDRLTRRARHALLAADRSSTDARLAVTACQAAARAMLDCFGYEPAADLFAAAVAAHERAGTAEPRAAMLVEHAETVLRCGRLAEARALFDTAARAAVAEGDVAAMAAAAAGLGGVWINEHRDQLDRERVAALQRRALAELPPDEAHLRHRLRLRLAAEAVYQGGPVDAAVAALDDARRLGDGRVLAEALSLVHHALLTPRHTGDRLPLADELIAVASRAGEGMLALLGLCWRTVDLFHLGDHRAERTLVELRRRADALGCLSIRYIVDAIETMLLIRSGRLEQAEACASACYELGARVGDPDATGILGAHLMSIRWLQGRDIEMLPMVEEIAGSPGLNPAEFAFQATAASLAARDGQREKAEQRLDRLLEPGLEALPESSTWLAGMLAIVEAARALDDRELARRAYTVLLPYAALPIMPSLAVTCFGSVERVLGLAALVFGDRSAAVAHLERAVAANRDLGNLPVTAVTRADLAEALTVRCEPGDRDRARELVERACADADSMGMTARTAAWRAILGRNPAREGIIRQQDRYWTLTVDDRRVVVADRVGMRYLALLLTNPHRAVPALELAGAPAGAALAATSSQPLADGPARAAYRRRVQQLTDDLASADARGDHVGSQRLQAELDALLAELRRMTGKGGRSRAFVDESERARTAVRKAIKRAIDEISATEPELGLLLRATVTTGYVCRYAPDPAESLTWTHLTSS
jgi:hypothetical protein